MGPMRKFVSKVRAGGLNTRTRKMGWVMLAVFAVAGLVGCMVPLDILLPISWLYTQTAKQGTVTATDVDDYYVIEMTDTSPTTVGFSNRPAREVASISTATFVGEWNTLFGNSPPNASVVFGESEAVYVFALNQPVFDSDSRSLWYPAKLISSGSAQVPPEQFDSVSVFIDNADQLQVNSATTEVSGIHVVHIDSGYASFTVQYMALPSTEPRALGSKLLVYSGRDASVYEDAPLLVDYIESDSPVGYKRFLRLPPSTTQEYTVAYASGEDSSSICATVRFGNEHTVGELESTTVAINAVGADSIDVQYRSCSGNKPHTNSNWVGLWEGPLELSVTPLASQSISSDESVGLVTINNVALKSGVSYTVAYMTGPRVVNAAGTVTFTP